MNRFSNSWEKDLDLFIKKMQVAGNEKRAEGMHRYMKSQFEYLGIPAPLRKDIFKSFKKSFLSHAQQGHLEDVILQLWEQEPREYQYCALDLMFLSRKYWKKTTIDLIERLILSKSWWDTVDMLAGKIAGTWFVDFPDNRYERIVEWIQHENMWLNRSAIIHQLGYKQNTDVDLLLKCITPYIHHKEFFLRKAIGWALRQYSKTAPQRVLTIVEALSLQPLSKKEALRLIKK